MSKKGRRLRRALAILVSSLVPLVPCALVSLVSRDAAAARDPVIANPDSALAIALAGIAGAPLSLEEAQRLAIDRSTDLGQARAARVAAEGAARRESGKFDPELFAEVSHTQEDASSASPFAGADLLRTKTTLGLAGARMQLPLGTRLEAAMTTTRLRTNSGFAALDPEYDAFGSLSITQPLLQGFGAGTRAPLAAAQIGEQAARSREDEATRAVQADVQIAYWDLYAAERDYAVQKLIVGQAEALLEETRTRAGAGLVGPSEVANARVFLAEQRQAQLDREEDLDRLSDRMARLIGSRPQGQEGRFRPTDEPPSRFPIAGADSLVRVAIERNEGLQAMREDVVATRTLARGAAWNALPALDLVASVGGNGLSGTPRSVIFGSDTLRTSISGSASDAWSDVFGRDNPTWSVGLRMSVPIGSREGRGERDRLRAEQERARWAVEDASRRLADQVRETHRELVNASRRLEAARDGVDAAQEQVRIGMIEYRNGRTTAFELVRLGADVASAQRRYSQALVRAAQAAAKLSLLTSGGYPGETGGSR
ncbi:MAG: TolC family protein [Candidatus Eisenbacteria bacterium]